MDEIIKNIKEELTVLRLKVNVIEKDEYLRRVQNLTGAVNALAAAHTEMKAYLVQLEEKLQEAKPKKPKTSKMPAKSEDWD